MTLLRNDQKYLATETAEAGGSSTPILLPRYAKDVTVTALPVAGGTATVQFTTDDANETEADPGSANWQDWDAGGVTAATSRSLGGAVTALRINAVTEDAVIQVCANMR